MMCLLVCVTLITNENIKVTQAADADLYLSRIVVIEKLHLL